MNAKEARKLAEERKEHEHLILIIEQAAKLGKFETNLEIAGAYLTEEYWYILTESDLIWLEKNGYKVEIRKEYHDFGLSTDIYDIEYVIW